jgi:hypothetical protein
MDNSPVTKADLKAAVDSAVQDIKQYVDERTHDAETRLLRPFVDYSAGSDVRLRKLEREAHTLNATTTERLGELERRVTDLDIRILDLERGSHGPR